SYIIRGFTFDHTGHLLHLHNDVTRRLIRRLLKGNLLECRRNAWIFSKGVYTRYPFQANLYGLPPRVIRECCDGLRAAIEEYGPDPVRSGPPLNFREWCERLFGRGISKHFMLPYNQKLWTVPAEKMTPEWCGQFVPRPKLEDVLNGARRDDTAAYGYNTTFLYPRKGGIQVLADALAQRLTDVRLGCSLEKVLWGEKKVLLSSGEEIPYSRLVSTLPLPELLKRLAPFPEALREPFETLSWTSVLCANIGVKRPRISDKSWIYFPEKKYVFYRAGFPMNFTPHIVPRGCSSMYVEVAHRPGKKYSQPAERTGLFRQIRDGLLAADVLRRSDAFPVVSFLPIPYAYVIYDDKRAKALQTIFKWLDESAGTVSIGRYGAWKYSFMEEAILDGRKAAQGIDTSY
ncbi:MAG: FAD-dependent oxidoreductase, partial [Elusimicrobia bacterium]|nr:FAD-dependent oxidoreductase [Elusimicrobiota bacterium]